MPVGPTPAGHQAELNLIYGMVDELSRQLSENRRATEDIVTSLGRLRNRARDRGLSNDDVLSEAAEEIFGKCLYYLCSLCSLCSLYYLRYPLSFPLVSPRFLSDADFLCAPTK